MFINVQSANNCSISIIFTRKIALKSSLVCKSKMCMFWCQNCKMLARKSNATILIWVYLTFTRHSLKLKYKKRAGVKRTTSAFFQILARCLLAGCIIFPKKRLTLESTAVQPPYEHNLSVEIVGLHHHSFYRGIGLHFVNFFSEHFHLLKLKLKCPFFNDLWPVSLFSSNF